LNDINTPDANEARKEGKNLGSIEGTEEVDIDEILSNLHKFGDRLNFRSMKEIKALVRYLEAFHVIATKIAKDYWMKEEKNQQNPNHHLRNINERILYLDGELPKKRFQSIILRRKKARLIDEIFSETVKVLFMCVENVVDFYKEIKITQMNVDQVFRAFEVIRRTYNESLEQNERLYYLKNDELSRYKMSISDHLILTNEKETIDLTTLDTSMEMSSFFDDEEEE